MAIEDRLVEWDGKSTDFLAETYLRFSDDSDFVESTLTAMGEPALEASSSWLLKRHVDEGHQLTTRQSTKLLKTFGTIVDWRAKLHVLQMLPGVKIGKRNAASLADRLHTCLEGENKFVRAWAYNGLLVLAAQHDQYAAEAQSKCKWAMENEAASVKARLRRAMAEQKRR